MIKLLEPVLIVIVRKEDLGLMRELVPECEREYEAIMKREAGGDKEYKTELRVNSESFLTAEQGGECGGVVLTSLDRRIVCNNTLKSRLDLCFEELLPQIRAQLFPSKVPAVSPEPPKEAAPHGGKHHK